MDGNRFDAIARGLARRPSRRAVVFGIGATALSALGLGRFGDSDAKTACRDAGHPCEGTQTCCDRLVCVPHGPGHATRCTPCADGAVASLAPAVSQPPPVRMAKTAAPPMTAAAVR